MISATNAGTPGELLTEQSPRDLAEEFREEAAARLRDLQPPAKRDERWRFADLKRVPREGFDQWQPVELEVEGLEEGVSCLSLSEALERDATLVRNLLRELRGSLGADYFMAHAQASELLSGACLWVEKGAQIENVIELRRRMSDEPGTGSAITLAIVEEGASVTILERVQGGSGCGSNYLASSGISLARNAQARYALSQELSEGDHFVHCAHGEIGRDGYGELAIQNLGASWVRQEAVLSLQEEGGSGNLLGVNLLQDEMQVDQHTRQHHSVGRGRSDLLFKNALYDRGRSIFGGLIQVDEGAHFTDAFQSCRNLLLSDEAEADAMPGLEINADQVRCSHGATSGQIDQEALFYLESRGIPEEAAKRLITIGFAFEALERLSSPVVRETLKGLFEERLQQRRRTS